MAIEGQPKGEGGWQAPSPGHSPGLHIAAMTLRRTGQPGDRWEAHVWGWRRAHGSDSHHSGPVSVG